MTTAPGNRHARFRRATLALVLTAAWAGLAAGCDKKDEHQHTTTTRDYETVPTLDRDLNPTELDSLRAMKTTHDITRDEYWQGRGGVVSSDRFEIWYYDRKVNILEAMAVLKLMEEARTLEQKTFGRVPTERLVVVCARSLEYFRQKTGRDWWHYSLIRGDTIDIQTPMTLHTRGLLKVGAPREYHEWALGKLTAGKAPRWVIDGMASYLAREAPIFVDQRREYIDQPLRMEPGDIEKALKQDTDRVPTRIANYNAYLMIERLVENRGLPAVAAFVLAFGTEKNADAAARSTFGPSYEAVVAEAVQWAEPAPPKMTPQ